MIPSERQAPTIARRQLAEVTRAIMVAADSRAACSQDLPLARLATAAAVSGSQRYCNLRIDDHSSAHGMPNARSALHTTFCVRSFAVMTSICSAMSLRETLVLRRVRVPHLKSSTARDFGLPSKRHWPQRGRGMGESAGANDGRSTGESASATQRAAVRCRSASRQLRQGIRSACPFCNTSTGSYRLPFFGITECLSEPSVPAVAAERAWTPW